MKKFGHLAIPYIAWAVMMLIFPVLLMFLYSFTEHGNSIISFSFTLEHYIKFFSDSDFLLILWRSFGIAVKTTVICLLLGYPLAYFIARSNEKVQNILVLCITIPTWINMLVRTYAWIGLLSDGGLFQQILGFFGFDEVSLLYTEGSVLLGMVYNFLPFMIYPIYNTLQKMDQNLIEAAQDLGANPVKVFGKVILPLSMPGIVSGIVMVFMPTVSTFAIAELLTMNNIKLFGTTVQENIYNGMWNYGAALSLIMLLLIGIMSLFTNEEDSAQNESGGVI